MISSELERTSTVTNGNSSDEINDDDQMNGDDDDTQVKLENVDENAVSSCSAS